ncbi:hypothetical protein PGT21_028391 [Puccinia graminis f. sp. tritici]|uniref:Uncharacterized protein n=1 Tax=Puccinia graminis f. sp. tritici TaxID=56615 RepID=A0A5B0Q748_PUCGR|nr:hypothetical protein PGT21_028391 [Puccinia graminis f. sp. tritici]
MANLSMDQKVLNVCEILRTLPTIMTPKEFMIHFIQSSDPGIAFLRRLWRQPRGVDSTMDLVRSIRNELSTTSTGREAWTAFIQEEANRISLIQAPPRGNYPLGRFHSSNNVGNRFFTQEEMAIHESTLINQDMPFLYNLILQMLNPHRHQDPDVEEECPGEEDELLRHALISVHAGLL